MKSESILLCYANDVGGFELLVKLMEVELLAELIEVELPVDLVAVKLSDWLVGV